MNQELDGLEEKVDQVLALNARVVVENLALRARLAALETEKQALAERMETARVRIETLMAGLPEE
ncbi:MAG: hypothetical protein M0P39_02560 [Rhodocyclaceae bacterium]|jgi:cell division protein ZapB|nr:hypothetical protein [Rhodocyclaceae bacterium]